MTTPRSKRKSATTRSSTEDKTSKLIDYVETLVKQHEQTEETNSELTLALDEKLTEISVEVESRMDQFMERLEQRLNQFLQAIEQPKRSDSRSLIITNDDDELDAELDSIANAVAGKSAGSGTDNMLDDWNRRKQQMLAEYGAAGDQPESIVDTGSKSSESSEAVLETTSLTGNTKSKSDNESDATANTNSKSNSKSNSNSNSNSKSSQSKTDASTKLAADKRQPPRLGDSDEDHALEALHDSIANLDKIDVAEIETLKEQLTSKLRDAEVELSINRAKLSQQWAALEQKQAEITQRESSLKSKYGNLTEATKKAGILDRFARHLTRREDDSR